MEASLCQISVRKIQEVLKSKDLSTTQHHNATVFFFVAWCCMFPSRLLLELEAQVAVEAPSDNSKTEVTFFDDTCFTCDTCQNMSMKWHRLGSWSHKCFYERWKRWHLQNRVWQFFDLKLWILLYLAWATYARRPHIEYTEIANCRNRVLGILRESWQKQVDISVDHGNRNIEPWP